MQSLSYRTFALENRRFLAFGFFAAFASSFGQTYFIGIFSPSVEAEFGLSHTAWATTYLFGTLASALVLPWSGKRIDSSGLRSYTVAALGILALGAALMSQVRNVALLAGCIFLLRQGGQGLMSHISVTSMARYFAAGRGRAIALASLGFAAGEALLPMSALGFIHAFGWRYSFALVAIALVVIGFPLFLWLLRDHNQRHEQHLEELARPPNSSVSEVRSWTRGEVLRDPRFYLLLPGLLAPAMIVTALFFTHLNLADAKGWSHAWVTGSYVIYAGATTVVALFCGPLIDRLGGTRLVPVMLLPMAVALVVAGTMREPWAVWPYFVFLGLSIGISQTAVAAMWAELYGVGSIGAIKSVVTSLAVLASAIGPVIMGLCMDSGIAIERVCIYFAGYVLAASVLIWIALRVKRR
jgi:MFS family permease